MELNGLIHSRYSSESQLADRLGWSRQKLNRITNGKLEPDLNDTVALSKALGVPLTQIANIFLQDVSTNGQQ